jgi:hypothetical protein
MAFPDLFKLEKLKIEAFTDSNRQSRYKTVEAMFNPSTISQRHSIRYNTMDYATGQVARFQTMLPSTLDVQLLFDGTGVDQIGLLTLFGKNPTVGERIAELVDACYAVDGDIHEPHYLTVTWGQFLKAGPNGGFRGRLSDLSINYASFDRDGSPLRAECNLSLLADDEIDRQAQGNPFFSPDLTHSRLARAGDTLPLLTAEIYGSERHVVEVARHNDLDHLRELEPGRELLFPPLER